MKATIRLALFVIAAFGFTSCDPEYIFIDKQELSGATWDLDDTIEFTFNCNDSLQIYDVFIDFRTNDSYEFSNLIYLLESDDQNGKTRIDTINFQMQSPDGTWYGDYSKSGNILTSKSYAQIRNFNNKKPYTFKLLPYHRTMPVEGVLTVGISIKEHIEE